MLTTGKPTNWFIVKSYLCWVNFVLVSFFKFWNTLKFFASEQFCSRWNATWPTSRDGQCCGVCVASHTIGGGAAVGPRVSAVGGSNHQRASSRGCGQWILGSGGRYLCLRITGGNKRPGNGGTRISSDHTGNGHVLTRDRTVGVLLNVYRGQAYNVSILGAGLSYNLVALEAKVNKLTTNHCNMLVVCKVVTF